MLTCEGNYTPVTDITVNVIMVVIYSHLIISIRKCVTGFNILI